MGARGRHVLIIADIEGSSGCWSHAGSAFRTPEWAGACLAMSRDVAAVVAALQSAGVARITVKDFHRTAYNLLGEYIDPRARVVSGYRRGPVYGLGDPKDAKAVLFVGLHAASGTGGFLAHTLTSRLARLEVNGRPLTEVELFAASLAPWGVRPVFFSGCPVACAQASKAIGAIGTFAIDKSGDPLWFPVQEWRRGLAAASADALKTATAAPYAPRGPFEAKVTLRDGAAAARRLARRWGMARRGANLFIRADRFDDLYLQLIRLCYLTPAAEKVLPLSLAAYNLFGRWGRRWVRRQLRLGRAVLPTGEKPP